MHLLLVYGFLKVLFMKDEFRLYIILLMLIPLFSMFREFSVIS